MAERIQCLEQVVAAADILLSPEREAASISTPTTGRTGARPDATDFQVSALGSLAD